MTVQTRPRAVVLLSGGLDSATCLAWAQQRYDCEALSFRYGQRHSSELDAAMRLARNRRCAHIVIINIDLRSLGGSALTDDSIDVPETQTRRHSGHLCACPQHHFSCRMPWQWPK
jgi:7-cyano-7-deazaguanine synthase